MTGHTFCNEDNASGMAGNINSNSLASPDMAKNSDGNFVGGGG